MSVHASVGGTLAQLLLIPSLARPQPHLERERLRGHMRRSRGVREHRNSQQMPYDCPHWECDMSLMWWVLQTPEDASAQPSLPCSCLALA